MPHRVAVVVRTKDRPVFLQRALDDIADQSFADAVAIIVNDGGDRETVDRVVVASRIANRTIVIDTPSGGGRCVAANEGLGAADSRYGVLHDDADAYAIARSALPSRACRQAPLPSELMSSG